MDLKKFIRDVPDFPKQGIIFKDITPLLKEGSAFQYAIDTMCERIAKFSPDSVWAVESRGFIFGSAVAYKMNIGFVPVRKKGKLPYKTRQIEYQLEYGTDILEVHVDAVENAKRVVIVDDVLATGGTASAVIRLAKELGAQVLGAFFVVELSFLEGRNNIASDVEVSALITY